MLRSIGIANAVVYLASVCLAQSQPSKSPVESVAFNRQEVDDVARILRIKKLRGTYRLNSDVNSVSLRLDFYRNGERLDVNMAKPGVQAAGRKTGDFLVQIVDLDYLMLGDGQAGHWRIHLDVTASDPTTGAAIMGSAKSDLPKAKFDAGQRMGRNGKFSPEEGHRHEAPIFWMATGKAESASTVEELLKVNRNCDLMIGYLEFK